MQKLSDENLEKGARAFYKSMYPQIDWESLTDNVRSTRLEAMKKAAPHLQYEPPPVNEDLVESMEAAYLKVFENADYRSDLRARHIIRQAWSAAARVCLDAALGVTTDEENVAAANLYPGTLREYSDNVFRIRRKRLLSPPEPTLEEEIESAIRERFGHGAGLVPIAGIGAELLAIINRQSKP